MSMTGALHVFSVDVLPHPASSLIMRCLSHQRSRTLTQPIRPGVLTHTVFPSLAAAAALLSTTS